MWAWSCIFTNEGNLFGKRRRKDFEAQEGMALGEVRGCSMDTTKPCSVQYSTSDWPFSYRTSSLNSFHSNWTSFEPEVLMSTLSCLPLLSYIPPPKNLYMAMAEEARTLNWSYLERWGCCYVCVSLHYPRKKSNGIKRTVCVYIVVAWRHMEIICPYWPRRQENQVQVVNLILILQLHLPQSE